MKRTAPDGSTMDYYQTASGRESFTMDNVSLGFEIDSMSNLGASFGVTRYGLRHNGYQKRNTSAESIAPDSNTVTSHPL